MNYLDVLFHPHLLMATVLYTLMAVTFEIIYQNLLHKVHNVPGTYWIARYLGLPFFHILLLTGFIYMSYPVLFGLESYNAEGLRILPTLSQLLNNKSGPTMQLINTLFVISVLLPLVPLIRQFMALILPLQAIAGSAVLYDWLAQYTGQNFSLFPGWYIAGLILLFSFVSELIARMLANVLSQWFNVQYHPHDIQKVVYKSSLLILQVPVLLLYTLNLK